MEKLLLTRKEAADKLSISVDTLDRIKAAGKIKSVNIGARVYFTPEAIQHFILSLVKEGWAYA